MTIYLRYTPRVRGGAKIELVRHCEAPKKNSHYNIDQTIDVLDKYNYVYKKKNQSRFNTINYKKGERWGFLLQEKSSCT